MKNKKILAVLLASTLVISSSALSAGAKSSYSDLSSYLLMNDDEGYDAYDINDDGLVNVFDLCRVKSDIINHINDKPVSAPVSFELSGDIDYRSNALYATLSLNSQNFKIDSFSLSLKDYDELYFYGIYTAENLDGDVDEADGKFIFDLSYDEPQKENSEVLQFIWVAEEGFKAKDYTINLSDISVTVDENGVKRKLSANEISSDNISYTFKINSNNIISQPDNPVTPDNPDTPDNPPALSGSDADIYNAMIALKKDYPEGMTWTNSNYYAWKGGIFSGGYGCAGFAFMLSDAAFGSLPARKVYDYNQSSIRIGDILRVDNDGHSVIVLNITDDGVIVAEGNFNSSIHWGRKITWSELQRTFTYLMTRYEE